MSLIFDALQRSEAERSGVELAALPGATELLERAEFHALSSQKPSTASTEAWSQSAERGPSDAPTAKSTDMTTAALGAARVPQVAADSILFEQFQSLKVELPPQSRLVCLTDSDSLPAEKFRFLGVSLQQIRRERPLKKVLITSTIPQEGKSMISANLACSLARRTQQRTLLVEGDVRRPAISQLFGLGPIPGICECLRGERDLIDSIYHLKGPGLWLLPSGIIPQNPLELLQSGRMPAMMESLSAWFDWVVIDSPPVVPLADTSLWMRFADGVLLVVRQGVTEKRQLRRGLEALESQKVVGALLNGSKRRVESDYYYARVPSVAPRANGKSIG